MPIVALFGALLAAVLALAVAGALPRRWSPEVRTVAGVAIWCAITFGQWPLLLEHRASVRRDDLMRVCRGRMKQLQLAMELYQQDNGGQWPESLARLHPDYVDHPGAFYCPRPMIVRGLEAQRMTIAPERTPTGEMHVYAQYAKENSDPALIPSQTDDLYTPPKTEDSAAILLEEKTCNHSRGWWPERQTLRHVMRVDGSIATVEGQ